MHNFNLEDGGRVKTSAHDPRNALAAAPEFSPDQARRGAYYHEDEGDMESVFIINHASGVGPSKGLTSGFPVPLRMMVTAGQVGNVFNLVH